MNVAEPIHTQTNTSKRRKMEKEKTFVLILPHGLQIQTLGFLLNEFEERGLTIIGLKMMNVNSEFAKTHLSRTGRVGGSFPTPTYPKMLKVGLTSKLEILVLPCFTRVRTLFRSAYIYSSATPDSANDDISLWFPDVVDKWSDVYLKKDLIFVFPEEVRGEEKKAELCYSKLLYKNLYNYYYRYTQIFVLIKPVAVRERIVNRIISGFEYNSGYILGLKLVNVRGLPSKVVGSGDSSSSGTTNDDYGVVMCLNSCVADRIRVAKFGNNHCVFNNKKLSFEVDSDLIYMSESGEESWDLAVRCFPFGFVVKTEDPFKRGILEASMTCL